MLWQVRLQNRKTGEIDDVVLGQFDSGVHEDYVVQDMLQEIRVELKSKMTPEERAGMQFFCCNETNSQFLHGSTVSIPLEIDPIINDVGLGTDEVDVSSVPKKKTKKKTTKKKAE